MIYSYPLYPYRGGGDVSIYMASKAVLRGFKAILEAKIFKN